MKITEVNTYLVGNPWKNWLFAQVETDEGIHGIGEGTLNMMGKTVEACIHELKPLAIGMDPFQVETIALRLTRDAYSDGGQIQGSALAAIETACWDIMGKVTNQPLYKLLGGRCHGQLRAYANGWYRGERTPEAFHTAAQKVVAQGYTALKFDPFGAAWRTLSLEELDLSVAIVAAVRDAVGPVIDIMVEGHNRFNVATAIRVAEAIAPYRPAWFETPVPPHRISQMVEVARRSPVPICCGEDYYNREQFLELLEHDAVSIINPEPQYLGLSAAKQVCGLAHGYGVVTAPHSAQGPLCTLAAAHLNLATPNFFIHEVFTDFNEDWEKHLLTYNADVRDGYIDLADDRPGLGAELNMDEIARHPYNPGNWLPLFKSGWEQRLQVDEG
ncbi:MAG: mandelate racemase/muconate lactonizing enzyme family protein [Chloroflexota bacterium]|nr:mandelate racemase/muconate lactonizing enzyme family protein [Chloroflexota bacterium]